MSIKSLGDLTPTAMLRKMRRLRPNSDHSSMLFRFGFLRILPSEISNILVVMEDEPLDSLAKKADRILEQKNDAPGSVAAISPQSDSPSVFSVGEVDGLRHLLRRDREGRNDQARGSRGTRGAPPDNSSICRNHAKWGTKSFTCRPGCLFADLPLAKKSGNANAGR